MIHVFLLKNAIYCLDFADDDPTPSRHVARNSDETKQETLRRYQPAVTLLYWINPCTNPRFSCHLHQRCMFDSGESIKKGCISFGKN